MARGGPDWFKGWEAFGTGVRLRVFPAYGGARRTQTPTVHVPAGTLKTLITVLGEGIIHGGSIYVSASDDHSDDFVYLYIDDQEFDKMTFEVSRRLRLNWPFSNPLWASVADDIFYNYNMNISPGYTFGEKVEIKYENTHPTNDIYVTGELYYAVAP